MAYSANMHIAQERGQIGVGTLLLEQFLHGLIALRFSCTRCGWTLCARMFTFVSDSFKSYLTLIAFNERVRFAVGAHVADAFLAQRQQMRARQVQFGGVLTRGAVGVAMTVDRLLFTSFEYNP